MRLLQLHTDFVEYCPVSKEIAQAEQDVSKEKVHLEDIVVTLVAIENGDDERLAKTAADEIRTYLAKLKTNRILIYPYAHLSSDLAPAESAIAVIKSIEKFARASGFDVYRAPFGWTKSFAVQVKGHPLSENFKHLLNSSDISATLASTPTGVLDGPREKVSVALSEEEKLESTWWILEPNGKMSPVADYDFKPSDMKLRNFVNYETAKRRAADEQPSHIKLMKGLGIADYEPASDPGNMRFYPKGKLMKSLIEQYVSREIARYGGMEVETPVMYDSKHPSMESYFNRFPARQYGLTSDNHRQLFLRFAACFGQFLMAKDFMLSYKHLPLRLYELTRYSFRREKSGELSGLRRLRAFSMPDCHAFCMDINQAKEELLKRFNLSSTVINSIGLSTSETLEMAIRFTQEFYNENRDFVIKLVGKFGRPVLVELWKKRSFYFILKWEFNFVDSTGKASALSTDQVDIENGSRYGIEFVAENGDKKNPVILHNSPSGAIERVIFALLENCSEMGTKGVKPSLPLWLAHTQVRIIAVGTRHLDKCKQICSELTEQKIRSDIDDRDESVSNKIRQSEVEWIDYTLVVGDKEIEAGVFVVRKRNQGQHTKVTISQLIDEIRLRTKGMPYLPLNLPAYLSSRPIIMA
ncbi:threonine--tRNA ligase [Nitrososphaera sp. AFS]|uniref:threonine--tRNA ligase n=1 Tax=Nitrososphaera sp. AFS TaxID=2301191 RepID=UPI0013922365|nr:threonine--tRNA ligase [Nitrososphaera sp. AFS]NAL76784.1 threonine--tRNA ligase [Nitrososphaera sp. AFS]